MGRIVWCAGGDRVNDSLGPTQKRADPIGPVRVQDELQEKGQYLFRSRRVSDEDIARQAQAARGSQETKVMSTTLDIYCGFFGLSERPFSLLPDPSFLYWSPQHKRAYTMLEYGLLTHAPITLITGEVGAGKTTLLHHLLKNLGPEVRVGFITNAQGTRGELLRWVLMALGVEARAEETYVDLFARFQAHLIDEYAQGRRVLLIFDEAQNLSRESLEELRMFTNINANKDELLQLILVGQPELNDLVRRPDMTQFAQRISSNYHLPAMDEETVRHYIDHRLKTVGARENFFARDAIALIHSATRGVPRLVNQLCDLSMLYAFTSDRKRIRRAMVEQVLNDGVFFAAGQRPVPGGAS